MRYYVSLMKKERVILLLLLLSALAYIPRISLVEAWTGVVYIRADGSVDPPTAPIQRNGDFYTLTGNIDSDTTGIVIERNNIVLDGAGYIIQGLGGSGSADHVGIILTGRNQVTIKNATITKFSTGIRVYQSTSLNISGNNLISNLNWGVYLWSSHFNTISENNVIENNNQGLDLTSSSNNNVTQNNIANSRLGLILSTGSSNNRILGNAFTDDGLHVYDSYENTVEGNTVNGKPLVYLEGTSSRTVDDAGQVVLINCDNIRVENLNISNTSVGLALWGTKNSEIANNTVSNNVYGVYLGSSSNNSIMENRITANKEDGISLYSSSNNSIVGNNITDNSYGLEIDESSSNTIIENKIAGSGGPGIYLSGVDGPANYNRISRNNLEDNNYGIWFGHSLGNNVNENNITLNHEYGVYLYQSSDNRIYHNNFVDSTKQVFVSDSASVWDDGYFSGGNYWSDYSMVDEKSGPNQDQLGSDGIGDSTYNSDHYPLMDVYSITPAYPIAAFTYLPAEPAAGHDVIFDATDSMCQNGTITTYYWGFGDGTFSGGPIVAHKYASYGSYHVTLTILSNSRLLSNLTSSLTVSEPPTASFHFSPTVNLTVGQSIVFDASSSTANGGEISAYVWDFGDGNTTSTAEPIVVHTFAQAEIYNVTLTVQDTEGLSSSRSQLVEVRAGEAKGIDMPIVALLVAASLVTGLLVATFLRARWIRKKQ